jgi:uncharacterized membrane protein
MLKKLNVILFILGFSAFVVGLVGMLNRDTSLLPLAGLLFILTGIVYTPVLYIETKNNKTKK